MKYWLFYSILFFSIFCKAQKDTASTMLKEVKLSYTIKAEKAFKETQFITDSLNPSQNQTLGDLLKTQTSIFVKSYGGNGVASLSLRGTSASHTQLYWNNLNITSPSLTQADYSLIPLQASDAINIQYGFASLIDGSGALGGSIRLNNHTDWKEKIHISLQQGIASFDQYQSSIQISLGTKAFQSESKIYYRSAQNQFTYTDITETNSPKANMKNNALWQKGIQQNFYWRKNANNLFTIKSWYNELERELPPPITGNPNQYDQMKDYSLMAIGEWTHAFKKGVLLSNSGIVYTKNAFTNGGDSISSNTISKSWQNNIRYKRSFMQQSLLLEIGTSVKLESINTNNYISSKERWNLSSFISLQKTFSKKTGSSLLLREEWVAQKNAPLLGAIGFYYKPIKNHTLKINAARNYRFPSFNDLYWIPGGNPELQNENSYSYEASIVQDITIKKYTLKSNITIFHNIIDNWISWVPSGNTWSPQNIKKVKNSGIEYTLNGMFKYGNFSFTQAIFYTYTRSKNTAFYTQNKAGVNKQLIYTPFHKGGFNIGINYKKTSLYYNQQFTGKYYITTDNKAYMPKYSIGNISLTQSIQWKKKQLLKASFSILNLYNWDYQILPYRPEPGIHYSFMLTYSFGS